VIVRRLWSRPESKKGTAPNSDRGLDVVADPFSLVLSESGRPSQRETLSSVELWWLARAYESNTSKQACEKCSAPLNRRPRLSIGFDSHGDWPASFTVTCSGWRRHRHIAHVLQDSGDLLLGRLHWIGNVSV